MRDAFGGTFMLKIALVFFVVYIAFMALAVQYAKAFRVKNQIINFVEQYQFTGPDDRETIDAIDAWLQKVPYSFKRGTENDQYPKCAEIAGADEFTYTIQGACIITKGGNIEKLSTSTRYYQVVTFIPVNMNFFKFKTSFPIMGETKVIYSASTT